MKKPLHLFLLAAFSLFQSHVSAQTTHQVSVTSNQFTPQNLTIAVGDIVEWTNTQGFHNVNGTIGTFPSNGESFGNSVGSGWTYSYTFNTLGSYDYHCDPHFLGGMVGTISVNAVPVILANDNCSNAALLTVESSCTIISFDSENATTEISEPAPPPGCGFYQGGDVWFRTVVPASGALRVERINGTLNAQFAIYSGTCGNMEVVSCAQLDAARTIHEPTLAGQEVYIRVWGYNTSTGGTFELCVWEPEIPVNNYCANAIELTVGETCNMQQYSGLFATESAAGAPNPGCGFYQGGDIWFTFEIPSSGEIRIDRNNLSGNAQYAVYTGSCGEFEVIDCAQLDGGTTLILPNLVGETAYLRVWGYNTEEGAEFEICIWDPPVPENDLCANAIPLSVGDSCQPAEFVGLYATTDTVGTAPSPGCGFYQGGDVWFTVEMPVTGLLHLQRTNISGNAQFALYEGTCGNFDLIDCAQLTAEMELDDPTLAGETLYLRVFGYNSEEGAEFDFCAFDTTCNSYETVIELGGNQLFSPQMHTSYLWLGCNPTPDPLSVEATFSPTVSGNYRLVADNPTTGCVDTSACINVTVTGLENEKGISMEVRNGAAAGIFDVRLGNRTDLQMQISDMQGRLIWGNSYFNVDRFPVDISGYSEGIYLLQIRTELGLSSVKLFNGN